jgi:hypothetical protein
MERSRQVYVWELENLKISMRSLIGRCLPQMGVHTLFFIIINYFIINYY